MGVTLGDRLHPSLPESRGLEAEPCWSCDLYGVGGPGSRPRLDTAGLRCGDSGCLKYVQAGSVTGLFPSGPESGMLVSVLFLQLVFR